LAVNFRPTRTKLRERERGAASPPPSSGSPSQAAPSDLEEFNSSTGGYNSGDEYGFCESQDLSEAEWLEVRVPHCILQDAEYFLTRMTPYPFFSYSCN